MQCCVVFARQPYSASRRASERFLINNPTLNAVQCGGYNNPDSASRRTSERFHINNPTLNAVQCGDYNNPCTASRRDATTICMAKIIFITRKQTSLIDNKIHVPTKINSTFFEKNVTFCEILRTLKRAYLFQDVLAKRLPNVEPFCFLTRIITNLTQIIKTEQSHKTKTL